MPLKQIKYFLTVSKCLSVYPICNRDGKIEEHAFGAVGFASSEELLSVKKEILGHGFLSTAHAFVLDDKGRLHYATSGRLIKRDQMQVRNAESCVQMFRGLAIAKRNFSI